MDLILIHWICSHDTPTSRRIEDGSRWTRHSVTDTSRVDVELCLITGYRTEKSASLSTGTHTGNRVVLTRRVGGATRDAHAREEHVAEAGAAGTFSQVRPVRPDGVEPLALVEVGTVARVGEQRVWVASVAVALLAASLKIWKTECWTAYRGKHPKQQISL